MSSLTSPPTAAAPSGGGGGSTPPPPPSSEFSKNGSASAQAGMGQSPPPLSSFTAPQSARPAPLQQQQPRRRREDGALQQHQQQRDDSGGQPPRLPAHTNEEEELPEVLLLRHRLGYSTVALTKRQRKTFTRSDLEDFLLYKEQKYNAVNVLGRFCAFLILASTVSIFCLIFSVSAADWYTVWYEDFYLGIGLFVACRQRVLRQCTSRTSSLFARSVVDPATGEVGCSVSTSWARGYIGPLWTFGILHLLGQTLALAMSVRMAWRPTRSKLLVWVIFVLLGCTIVGIINCVLFPNYVRCERRTCAVRGEAGDGALCNTEYGWSYDLYIAATAMHFLCFFIAFSMWSYVHGVRTKAEAQLRQERRRKTVEEAAEEFVRSIMEGRGVARRLSAAPAAAPGREEGQAAGSLRVTSRQPSPHYQQQQQQQQQRHDHGGPLSMSGTARSSSAFFRTGPTGAAPYLSRTVITREGDPYTDSPSNGFILQHTLVRQGNRRSREQRPDATADGGGRRGTCRPGEMAPQPRELHVTLARSHEGSVIYASEAPTAQQSPLLSGANAAAQRAGEPREYREARQHRRRLERVFSRSFDPTYLTAAELGVPIAGADDWLYDDASDMYYSFDLNMFWDPLTGEYFNCALRTWQESPDHVVDIRDAMQYAWLGEEEEEEEEEHDEGGMEEGEESAGDDIYDCGSGDADATAEQQAHRDDGEY